MSQNQNQRHRGYCLKKEGKNNVVTALFMVVILIFVFLSFSVSLSLLHTHTHTHTHTESFDSFIIFPYSPIQIMLICPGAWYQRIPFVKSNKRAKVLKRSDSMRVTFWFFFFPFLGFYLPFKKTPHKSLDKCHRLQIFSKSSLGKMYEISNVSIMLHFAKSVKLSRLRKSKTN